MPRVALPTGISASYEWHGRPGGTPVVLIRGLASPGSRWEPQLAAYGARYRCLSFDNRGSGESDKPAGPYSMDLLAADTAALLDALDVKRAHIAGLALGCAVALCLALRDPARVASLMLHGTAAKMRGRALEYFSLARRLVERGGLDLYYDVAIFSLFSPRFFDDHDRFAATLARMKASGSTVGFLGQLDAMLGHDVAERVHAIAAPTLVTVGELDMVFPVPYAEELAAKIPGARLEVFRGGSHQVAGEDAATFNRVTLAWLDQHA